MTWEGDLYKCVAYFVLGSRKTLPVVGLQLAGSSETRAQIGREESSLPLGLGAAAVATRDLSCSCQHQHNRPAVRAILRGRILLLTGDVASNLF